MKVTRAREMVFSYPSSFNMTPSSIICPVCGKPMSRKNLKRHISLHQVTEKVQCEQCGVQLKKSQLRDHKSGHRNQFYACKEAECTYKTKRSSNLTRHTAVHKGFVKEILLDLLKNVENFVQDTCKDIVNDLITNLNPNQDNKCRDCPRSFNCHKKLQKHKKRVHSIEKQATCEHCGKVLACIESLKRHINAKHQNSPSKHTPVNLNCKQCGNLFVKNF